MKLGLAEKSTTLFSREVKSKMHKTDRMILKYKYTVSANRPVQNKSTENKQNFKLKIKTMKKIKNYFCLK